MNYKLNAFGECLIKSSLNENIAKQAILYINKKLSSIENISEPEIEITVQIPNIIGISGLSIKFEKKIHIEETK